MPHEERTPERPLPSGSMRRRTSALLVVALLVVSACGSSDGTEDENGATTTAAPVTTAQDGAVTTAAPTTAAPATTQPAGEGDASGVSTATVSIAGETYQFQDTGFITETCDTDFFGGVQVILLLVDENGEPVTVDSQTKTLSIVLLPEGVGETPDAVNLGTMEADRDWIADPESLVVEGTQVDSWSVDGNRIEGTATFASTAGEGPTEGTFEVTCAEE